MPLPKDKEIHPRSNLYINCLKLKSLSKNRGKNQENYKKMQPINKCE